MFYEAMEEILPSVKIIINNDEDGTTQRMYLGDLDSSFGGASASGGADDAAQGGSSDNNSSGGTSDKTGGEE
jgi:hypothetical protein